MIERDNLLDWSCYEECGHNMHRSIDYTEAMYAPQARLHRRPAYTSYGMNSVPSIFVMDR